MTLFLTYGERPDTDAPQRIETTWPALVEWLRARTPAHGEKTGPWLCFADFNGRQRAYENLVASYAVPLDLDLGRYIWTADDIRARLAGYQFVAWTSYSHRPEAPRWRIVIPVDQSMSRWDHYATWETLASVFARDCGESSKDATRLNYLPGACLHPEHAQFIAGDGAPWPVTRGEPVPEGTADGLTDAPVDGWNGPTDDAQLLAYAMAGTPAERAFGAGKSYFARLWNGDDSLAAEFPHHEQTFDHTRADAALANELAYLTGGHGTRIVDLMMQAPLCQREKFREDKARRAAIIACRGRTMYAFMRPVPAIAGPTGAADPATPEPANNALPPAPDSSVSASPNHTPDGGAPHGQSSPSDFFAYLPDHTYIHRPTGGFWPAASLDGTIGKDARMMLDITVPVHLLSWAPGLPERFQLKELDTSNHRAADSFVYNQYRAPRRSTASPAQIDPWLRLLYRLYPNDADHILRYFAHAVQFPGIKTNHALVLGSGTHGIGKDTLLKPLRRGVGESNYSVIQPKALFADFNPWVTSVVVQISEMRNIGDGDGGRISKYDMYERCKDLAAAPPATLERNAKHISQQQVANVLRLIITTNHGIDGIFIDPEDRRHYCAWSDAAAMAPDEALALHAWLDSGGTEAVCAFLQDPSLIDGWNPGARPPQTDWWRRLVLEGMGEENPLADALAHMGSPQWITAEMLAKQGGPAVASWLADSRNRKQIARHLAGVGYRRLVNAADRRGRFSFNKVQMVVYAREGVRPEDVR